MGQLSQVISPYQAYSGLTLTDRFAIPQTQGNSQLMHYGLQLGGNPNTIANGSAYSMWGQSTLAAGVVDVVNPFYNCVLAGSPVNGLRTALLMNYAGAPALANTGALTHAPNANNTGFRITSTNALDANVVNWMLFNPVFYYPDSFTGLRFDGNTRYNRGAGLTGAADSTRGYFSCWFEFEQSAGDGQNMTLFANSNDKVRIIRRSNGKLGIFLSDPTPTVLCNVSSTRLYTSQANTGWHHLFASWNLNNAGNPLFTLLVDGENVFDPASFLTGGTAVDYTTGDWSIGAQIAGTTPLFGCLGEIYFAMGTVGPSPTIFPNAFRDYFGRPQWLGSNGAMPDGAVPIVYINNDLTANRGSGGNFALTAGGIGACFNTP